jgi:hypothetical protein
MFYGVPPGREKELQQALATVADIFKGLGAQFIISA